MVRICSLRGELSGEHSPASAGESHAGFGPPRQVIEAEHSQRKTRVEVRIQALPAALPVDPSPPERRSIEKNRFRAPTSKERDEPQSSPHTLRAWVKPRFQKAGATSAVSIRCGRRSASLNRTFSAGAAKDNRSNKPIAAPGNRLD